MHRLEGIFTMTKWVPLFLLILIESRLETSAYRLPRSVIPRSYDLEIITHLDEPINSFTFDGKIMINIRCSEKTTNITLHSNNLEIDGEKTLIRDVTSRNIVPVNKQEKITEDEFYVIHLSSQLTEGHEYEIMMKYKGHLVDGLYGYYRSSYVDQDTNEKHWLAVTQFEPTSARKAFPCFDEPHLKAKFKLSMGHRSNLSALSNMPSVKTEPMDTEGWVWDRFEESVPMSTYIVAFMVSDMKYISSPSYGNKNIDMKIWARDKALNQAKFAAETGPKVLDFFENKFMINYPLPKVDMVAIPDFASGAMENWGLITYRETALLYDPTVSTLANKERVAEVVSHELAHQWFGNLVTMKWWTDLWLNEGFATFMAAVAVNHVYPEWNFMNDEVVNSLASVYRVDALKSSHPISIVIKNPSEISQIFDSISYKKGNLIIRMMSLFLTENVLFSGVSNYLQQNSYGNAAQDDLWLALTQEGHKKGTLPYNMTVKQVMDTWTLQTGYPVVNIMRNYNNNTAQITQSRFLKGKANEKTKGACWWIPLSYTDQIVKDFNTTTPKLWLHCPKDIQTIKTVENDKWILFNVHASGLYKVNYDKKNWEMLISTMKTSEFRQIPELNRVLLIDNSFDFASIGHISYEIPFRLISYLKQETSFLPWQVAMHKLNQVSVLIKRSSVYGHFKEYVRSLLSTVYQKIGGLKIDYNTIKSAEPLKHHVLIAKSACEFGVPECITEAKEQFALWKTRANSADNPIQPDLRSVVYCAAVEHGDEEVWEFLWRQYKQSNVSSEQILILSALSCTNEIWILNRLLDWTLTDNSGIRTQDIGLIYSYVARNDVGYFVYKMFLENKIKDVLKRLSSNEQRLSYSIDDIARQQVSEYEKDEFTKFTTKYKNELHPIHLTVQQGIETTSNNIHWYRRYLKDINYILMYYTSKK